MKKVYFSNIFAFLFLISSTLFAQEHHADSTAEHVATEAVSTEITAHAEGEGHGEEAEPFKPWQDDVGTHR